MEARARLDLLFLAPEPFDTADPRFSLTTLSAFRSRRTTRKRKHASDPSVRELDKDEAVSGLTNVGASGGAILWARADMDVLDTDNERTRDGSAYAFG